jgi:hypothetical protein
MNGLREASFCSATLVGRNEAVNKSGKRICAAMLFIVIGTLAVSLSYVSLKALHHADPNAQPHAPLHDPK